MDNLMTRCIAHIQSIIEQLYADLDACPDNERAAEIRAAIKRLEDALHQYEK